MACELRHSRERLTQWAQEHRPKRRAQSGERVEAAADRLELAVAQGAVQVERLQREAQRAEEALAAAKARRTEAAAEQERAQLALARDLQASLRAEKDLLEQLEEAEEEAKADTALRRRAEALSAEGAARRRELRCREGPLQAALRREEAVVAALQAELEAGHHHAGRLAVEAADARQRKQHFQEVREPLIAYFATRAYQDWEAQRADGLRRRLVLRRVLAAWRPLRALLQRQRERAEEYRLQTSSRWMRLLLLGWRQAQEDWRAAVGTLGKAWRAWADLGRRGRWRRAAERRTLAAVWRHWRARREGRPTVPAPHALGIAEGERKDRQRLVAAFRGWRADAWRSARREAALRRLGRWQRRRGAARALGRLRAAMHRRHLWQRLTPLMWALLARRLCRPHPLLAWRCWFRRRLRGRRRARELLARRLRPALALSCRRVAWSAWRGRVVAGRFAADKGLQLAWGMKRQQLKRRAVMAMVQELQRSKGAWLLAHLVRASSGRRCLQHWCCHLHHCKRWRQMAARARRAATHALRCLMAAWATLVARRRRTLWAETKVRRMMRSRLSHKALRRWLLAFAREVLVALSPSQPGQAQEEARCFHLELAAAERNLTCLKQQDTILQDEPLSLRASLSEAEQQAQAAAGECQRARGEFEACAESLNQSECQEVEQELCKALRVNAALARELHSASRAAAGAGARVRLLEESSVALRKQLGSAEEQYVAALATLCAEALRVREQPQVENSQLSGSWERWVEPIAVTNSVDMSGLLPPNALQQDTVNEFASPAKKA
ncbi:unnamed protein product [Effrenium voratum]|nr:unnamed protein product [Effrenium voratum]